MDWAKAIRDAVAYIEDNITENLTVGRIAGEVNISAFYFQKGFSMLCGYTVGEYIRMRRLSLAGSTPTEVKKNGALLKSFAPLQIKLTLEGGTVMEYRMEQKPAFKVMGLSRKFSYETANEEVPKYWDEVIAQAKERPVMGMYGICFDEEMKGNEFRYMIADDWDKDKAFLKGLEEYEVPAHTWAVFPCRGAMPLPLQEVNRKIFSEWLPAGQYEIAEGYNIEYYSNPEDFTEGMQDSEYYAEVWIPVKEK